MNDPHVPKGSQRFIPNNDSWTYARYDYEPLMFKDYEVTGQETTIRRYAVDVGEGKIITEREFNLMMSNPELTLKHILSIRPKRTMHAPIISNKQPKKQRMVKPTVPWTLTAERSVAGEQVWAKKSKSGTLIMGVPGDNGKIRRVSAQYVYSGTHPAKKIYKRKPGVNPRKPAGEYLMGTGVTRKGHAGGMKKFKAALTAYGRRKDRKAADQPFNTNAETYDPLTQDMPGVDDQKWNDHLRRRQGGWIQNKERKATAAVAASKARKAARIAAGIPLKRAAPNGRGKGAFPAYLKANYHALSREVPPGYTRQEHARQVMKLAAERYRGSHMVVPGQVAGPNMALDAKSLKRGLDDDNDTYDPADFRRRGKFRNF